MALSRPTHQRVTQTVRRTSKPKMRNRKYTFNNLRRHTESIRVQTSSTLQKMRPSIDQAFDDFDNYLSEVESQLPTLERNVRMTLACKLLNHVYSAFILTESGLIVDAVLCERNALETVAFHWLICLDPVASEEYEKNKAPRPVEVRRRLEQLGADVTHLRDIYAAGSETSHVGRKSERFHSKWESASKGKLLFGGDLAPEDQAEMFQFLLALLYLFCQPMMK